MENQTFTNVRKLTTSGIVIALYVVILFMTQSFSFGAYQIRIVTSLHLYMLWLIFFRSWLSRLVSLISSQICLEVSASLTWSEVLSSAL